MSPNSGCWVSNFLEEDLGTTPNPLLRLGRFTSSWRDVPSPDAGRIVGSNLRLGHLQGGSSANALQERLCTRLGRCFRIETGLPATSPTRCLQVLMQIQQSLLDALQLAKLRSRKIEH